MSKINGSELRFKNGKLLHTLPKGSLFAPFPIPAYKILASKKEHFAVSVLMCLVSHLGYKNKVNPSIETIIKMTGRGERSVRQGINVLLAYGFIEKVRTRKGKIQHCEYTINDHCYQMTPAFRQSINEATRQKMLLKIKKSESKSAAKQKIANNSLKATEINQWPTDNFL